MEIQKNSTMNSLNIPIINRSHHPLPLHETELSAGLDLRAFVSEPLVLAPGERSLIPTGLFMALPAGYEAQVRPRSGLALKHGITVLNSPGTIDADYRGEIKVLLINHGSEAFEIKDGDRMAQMVVAKHERIEWTLSESLDATERGAGGYGSSGV
jgi:dUTP pyrophosphatase